MNFFASAINLAVRKILKKIWENHEKWEGWEERGDH